LSGSCGWRSRFSVAFLGNEEILQLMLFSCPDGVVVVDRNGKVILYTGSFRAVFEFAPIDCSHHPARRTVRREMRTGEPSPILLPTHTVHYRENCRPFARMVRVSGRRFGVRFCETGMATSSEPCFTSASNTGMRNIERLFATESSIERSRRGAGLPRSPRQLTGLLNRGSAMSWRNLRWPPVDSPAARSRSLSSTSTSQS